MTHLEDPHGYSSELVQAWIEVTRLREIITTQADKIAKLGLELQVERTAKLHG